MLQRLHLLEITRPTIDTPCATAPTLDELTGPIITSGTGNPKSAIKADNALNHDV